ncbi:unnamed protein product [Mycena citricolor]|uniref:Peptidase S33 tripeptidyl aminopeptidase-like C-terminal domain-containing protein n=1 Tax=Mycena citricolor TaxID=2018698 RepID=A0AAD2HM90_9AGAR|nr:unnamed protein product [Mycena citricolor]
MLPTRTQSLLLFIAAVGIVSWTLICLDSPHLSFPKDEGPIAWTRCKENAAFFCGYLECVFDRATVKIDKLFSRVPTDYENREAGSHILAVTKYPTSCPPSERLGIVMTNYGGPGVSGRASSFQLGPRLQELTGNRYDIISFDQRGHGHSLPKLNCFGSALGYETFKANTVLETTFLIPEDPFSPEGRAILIEQQRAALALERTQGLMCENAIGGEALGFMSTTTTVYDMEEISRILEGENALINFASVSHFEPAVTDSESNSGEVEVSILKVASLPDSSSLTVWSIVGAYLANMLPHKTGKVLIDGVVPADMWANDHYESQTLLRVLLGDSEKTYQYFLSECFVAGPQRCSLVLSADGGPSDIGDRIDQFLDRLQEDPMPVVNYDRVLSLTSGHIRSRHSVIGTLALAYQHLFSGSLFTALQIPSLWALYAEMLASAMYDSDASQLLLLVAPPYSPPSPEPDQEGYIETGQGDLWRLILSCGDALPYPGGNKTWPTAEEIVDNVLVTMETWPRFGGTVHLMEQHGGCQYWAGTGVGPTRYRSMLASFPIFDSTGTVQKTLTTPALLLANTHDPITPYSSAKIVQNTMGASSRLVLQDVPGHSYLAPTTQCAIRLISEYFANGVIPEDAETFCSREIDNYFESLTDMSDAQMILRRI